MRQALWFAVTVLGAVLLCGRASSAQQADVAYINGDVATMDGANPSAEAIATKGEDILAVGTNAEIQALVGPDTRVVDLHGHTVLPGFIDAHSHMLSYGFYTDTKYWTDVSNINLHFKP